MDVIDFLIDEEITMLSAMEQLDKVARKVLFVTREGKFAASITDGDIRRWILKKGNLDAKVKEIANYNPKSILEEDKIDTKKFMNKHSIDALPVIDKNNYIKSIIFRNNLEIKMKKLIDVPVVIMAGGLGTRLYPYTKILPKPLIPIGEIPIVEHIINRFSPYGCTNFFLIVNHKKNMIKAYFSEIENLNNIEFVDENIPLGTGGGLSLLKGKIKSTFILSNCDILIDEDFANIFAFHIKEKNKITMVCSLKSIKIPYGVVEINELGEIENMKEKPEFSFFTNTGLYIVEPEIIESLSDNEYVGFPDIIEKYKSNGEKVGVYPISEYSWLDMGQLDDLEKMRKRIELDE